MKKPINPKVRHPIVGESGHKDSEQYPPSDCDDCAICRGLREAEDEGRDLSMEELHALFQKQNTQN